jgi:molybdopterin synthase catalytic subunit
MSLARRSLLQSRFRTESMFEATENPIHPELVVSRMRGDGSGATVTFIGSLRGTSSDGGTVLHANCDLDRETAERQLRGIGKAIRARWGLEDVSICHRLGRIEVGDAIAVVAIAAPHRQEAFEACQYAIDRFKEFMPLREVVEAK